MNCILGLFGLSRSYYPGAPVSQQQQFTFKNVRVLHDQATPLMCIGTPVDAITISNSSLCNNSIRIGGDPDVRDH